MNENDKIKEAMTTIGTAMAFDPAYAWSWHCNIAMASVDRGMNHKSANEAAADFMRIAFSVDTTKCEQYAALMAQHTAINADHNAPAPTVDGRRYGPSIDEETAIRQANAPNALREQSLLASELAEDDPPVDEAVIARAKEGNTDMRSHQRGGFRPDFNYGIGVDDEAARARVSEAANAVVAAIHGRTVTRVYVECEGCDGSGHVDDGAGGIEDCGTCWGNGDEEDPGPIRDALNAYVAATEPRTDATGGTA
jgi:hypothetical protein